MEETLAFAITAVTQAGLWAAPEKILCQPPWKYLSWHIRIQTIIPQSLQIQTLVHCTLLKSFWGQLIQFILY